MFILDYRVGRNLEALEDLRVLELGFSQDQHTFLLFLTYDYPWKQSIVTLMKWVFSVIVWLISNLAFKRLSRVKV